eukprot:364367-Chlamydomonas_euryale.AAC.7
MRCALMRCAPMRCAPMRCTPTHCALMRKSLMRCALMHCALMHRALMRQGLSLVPHRFTLTASTRHPHLAKKSMKNDFIPAACSLQPLLLTHII